MIWISNGSWKRQKGTTNQKKEVFPDFGSYLLTQAVNLQKVSCLLVYCPVLSAYQPAVSNSVLQMACSSAGLSSVISKTYQKHWSLLKYVSYFN